MAQGGSYKWLISILMFMMVLTLLSIVSGGAFYSINVDQTFSAVVNGTTTDYDVVSGGVFSITALEGAIGWLILIAAIGVVAGITILASGLGTASVKLLYKSIFYGIIWGLVSLYPVPLMYSIPFFGGLFYITLTIVYTVAVLMVI